MDAPGTDEAARAEASSAPRKTLTWRPAPPAYVREVQSRGVGACIEHFVANDSEHERFTMSSDVPERRGRVVVPARPHPGPRSTRTTD